MLMITSKVEWDRDTLQIFKDCAQRLGNEVYAAFNEVDTCIYHKLHNISHLVSFLGCLTLIPTQSDTYLMTYFFTIYGISTSCLSNSLTKSSCMAFLALPIPHKVKETCSGVNPPSKRRKNTITIRRRNK